MLRVDFAGVFASVEARNLRTSIGGCDPLAALPLLAIFELASLLSPRLVRPNEMVRRVAFSLSSLSAFSADFGAEGAAGSLLMAASLLAPASDGAPAEGCVAERSRPSVFRSFRPKESTRLMLCAPTAAEEAAAEEAEERLDAAL